MKLIEELVYTVRRCDTGEDWDGGGWGPFEHAIPCPGKDAAKMLEQELRASHPGVTIAVYQTLVPTVERAK